MKQLVFEGLCFLAIAWGLAPMAQARAGELSGLSRASDEVRLPTSPAAWSPMFQACVDDRERLLITIHALRLEVAALRGEAPPVPDAQ